MDKQKVLLILCAFCGGIILSMTELANMFKSKEIPDIYFFGGMLIAGFFGVIGFFIAGATNFRTAFVSGVSAPQLIGGIVKLGTSSIQTISCLIVPAVYAQPNIDSINVKVIVEQIEQVEMKTNDSVFVINDSIDVRIKYQDTLFFVGKNFNRIVELKESDSVRIVISNEDTGFKKFLRGMFAQKQKDQISILKE